MGYWHLIITLLNYHTNDLKIPKEYLQAVNRRTREYNVQEKRTNNDLQNTTQETTNVNIRICCCRRTLFIRSLVTFSNCQYYTNCLFKFKTLVVQVFINPTKKRSRPRRPKLFLRGDLEMYMLHICVSISC